MEELISKKQKKSICKFKSGDIYGRLMLTGKSFANNSSIRFVEAICDCGVIKFVRFGHFKNGEIQSCGCLRLELSKDKLTTHGLSRHPLFSKFACIKNRCYNKHDISYPHYGGVGVTICEEWLNSFQSFYNWAISAGWRKGLQIDKDKLSPYKTGKIYSPEYCCFLTPKQNMQFQSRTKHILYKGEKKTLSEWCDITGLNFRMVWKRLYYCKWDIERAFETPSLRG